MWSLHFLLLVVVIDIANEEISLYLCLILSMFFLVFVVRDVWADRKNERKSKATWDIARRKQASSSRISRSRCRMLRRKWTRQPKWLARRRRRRTS